MSSEQAPKKAQAAGSPKFSIGGSVVPPDIQHPKRVAKYIQRLFRKSLGSCQHVTAHLLGHRDWHTLEQAIARNDRRDPFDEDLLSNGEGQRLKDRRMQQRDLLLAELGDDHWYTEDSLTTLRQRVCADVIEECRPTASQFPAPLSLFDCRLHPAPQAWMAELPDRLAQWWQESVPEELQSRADYLEGDWSKDRPSQVLAMLNTWIAMSYRAKKHVETAAFHGGIGLFAVQYALLRLLAEGKLQEHYGPGVSSKVVPIAAPLHSEMLLHVGGVLDHFPTIKIQAPEALHAASSLYKRLEGQTLHHDDRADAEEEAASRFSSFDEAIDSDMLPPIRPEPSYRFMAHKHISLKRLPRADYENAAHRYIETLGPPLSGELRSAVVRKAVDGMFWIRSHVDIEAVLEENESWIWPALAEAYPPSDSPGIRSPWGRNSWRASVDVSEIERLREVPFKGWFWNEPMASFRSWQKQFLPAKQHSRRKFEMQLALLKLDPFPEPILQAFIDWKRGLEEKLERAREAAALPPVPKHLEYLINLVSRRLDAWHTLVNSPKGPESFAPFEQAALAAARSARSIDIATAEATVDDVCRTHRPTEEDPKLIAESAKGTLRKMLPVVQSPRKLERHLAQWRPSSLLIKSTCGCRTGNLVQASEDQLPPYSLRCFCGKLEWKTKWDLRSRDNEPIYACTQFDDQIEMWAVGCLLGLDDPPFPYITISVKASSEQRYRDWYRT